MSNKTVRNLFKKMNCEKCKYYDIIDANGIESSHSGAKGWGHCSKRITSNPSSQKLCIEFKKRKKDEHNRD